jgi:hypothetical protein
MDQSIRPRGRPADAALAGYVREILALPEDSSIFIADATRVELEFLRKPVREAGAGIEIVSVELDEIYQVPGVRVFRRTGEYDQL